MAFRYRLCGALLLLAAACAGGEGAPAVTGSNLAGTYRTDTLTTADGGTRVITLELQSGAGAILTTAYPGRDSEVRKGQWSADGPNLTVILADPAPAETLAWRQISSRLVPVRWNRDLYGEAGLTLNHD